jgi:PleD family two-component response regulator
MSIGAVSHQKVPADPQAILGRVDAVMYEAKKNGKGVMRHIQG